MNAISLNQNGNYLPYSTNRGSSGDLNYSTANEKKNSQFSVATPQSSFVGEYMSYDKVTLNYTGKDGDSFSFNYENLQMLRATIGTEGYGDELKENDDFQKMLTDLYDSIQKKIVEKLSESLGISVKNSTKVDDTLKSGSDEEIEGLPEYWNAENTAQRIFDFSVSFFSVSSQDAEGYYSMMREAIIKGYDEAVGEIGSVSSAVSALSEKTLKLALEKLDDWARDQGVDVEAVLGTTEE